MAKRFPVNDAAFSTITPESAYWLGLLMADGCVTLPRQVRLTLDQKDVYQLHRFYKFVGANQHKIHPNGTCNQCSFTSEQIVHDLIGYGIIPLKSTTDTAAHPSLAQHPSFWLGVMDGDGSIGHYRQYKNGSIVPCVRFSGNKSLMEQASTFIYDRIQRKAKPRQNKQCDHLWEISLRCHSAQKLLTILYENEVPWLNRKKEIADKALTWVARPVGKLPQEHYEKLCICCDAVVTRRVKKFSDLGVFCSRACWYEWMKTTGYSTKLGV